MNENTQIVSGEAEEYEIDLLELLILFRNHAIALVALMLGAGVLCLLVCKFLLTPRYEASIDMIVNSRQDTSSTITNDNITTAKNLASTYAIVIKSNLVLDEVIDTLGLELSYKELYNAVSVESVDSTQIIEITVENEDPQLAGKIVETIAAVAPDLLVDVVEAGSCKIVSKVEINNNPVFPSTQKYVAIVMVLTLFVSYGVFLLMHLLRNYIEDDEDVQKKLDLPVLGLIPEV